MTNRIIHLVDDATPGGVTRMLAHIDDSPAFARQGSHSVRVVRRGARASPRLDAEVIVSHLSISWRNLPLLTMLRALHPAARLIHVEHSYTEAFVAANPAPRARFAALMTTAFALFDRVVAVSTPQGEWLVRRGFVAASSLQVIPPAVDLSPFLALDPHDGSAPRTLGLIGRLDTQKGFDIAIEAFRAAARVDQRLEVWGEGPERERLEALASGDGRIRFCGWADRPEAALSGLDAVLMPSRCEAFGLVALEAQAAGRVVLVAECDGLVEHVPSGAIPVGGRTVAAWEAAIRALHDTDLTHRVMRGRQRARGATGRFAAAWARLLDPVPSPADVPLMQAV